MRSFLNKIRPYILFLLNRKYLIFSVSLTLFFIFYNAKNDWKADFWEHAATIKELSINPVHPNNPIINSNAPHAFFSPYHLGLALLVKFTNITVVKALYFFSIINLILLLSGIYLFYRDSVQRDEKSFYTILFFIFLWSGVPPSWSGFLGFNAIIYSLPYPSTFSIALSFIVFYFTKRILISDDTKKTGIYIPLVILINTIVILSHPITAFASVLVQATIIVVHSIRSKTFRFINYYIIVSISILLLLYIYPYYNFFGLLGNSTDYDFQCRNFYLSYLFFVFLPLLFAGPLLVFNKTTYNTEKAIIFLLFLIIYFFGYFSGKYGFGRILSPIAMLCQIIIAEQMVKLEVSFNTTNKKLFFVIITSLLLLSFNNNIADAYKQIRNTETPFYKYYQNLENFILPEQVVLCDYGSTFKVNTFGGKTVATYNPQYFEPRIYERRKNHDIFFGETTSSEERKNIIQKYKVDFILLQKKINKRDKTLEKFCESNYSKIYENEIFILFKINNYTK